MRYEVTHGKDVFSVDVHDVGGGIYDVTVDEETPVRIDAAKSPRTVYSLLIDSKQFEGSVDERDDGRLDVHVGSSAFDFEVIDERRKALLSAATTVVQGKQDILAQMPGKIVKVLVEVGQEVSADEGVIVMEAMKMENEIKSPIDGVVTEVSVAEGDAVETDAKLLVIDPPFNQRPFGPS